MKLDLRALENPFPPVYLADSDGVLTVSEFISPELTITAYLNGIFPWPIEARYILWFAPPRRSIIRFDDFHIPHGARRELKKKKFTFSVNQHFSQVIHGCANAPRGDEPFILVEPQGSRRAVKLGCQIRNTELLSFKLIGAVEVSAGMRFSVRGLICCS